ncbi:MAG: hypothetical protein ACREUQ_08445, partial [Burkholderiales bacterium]
ELTWQYAEPDVSAAMPQEQPNAAFLPPPRPVLEELLELARLGKLVRVEQLARDLESRDKRYRPFAQRLYGLARGFEEERLVQLLQDCLGTVRDVVTD